MPAVEASVEVAEEQIEEEVATRKRPRHTYIAGREWGGGRIDDHGFEHTSEELASAVDNVRTNLSAHEASVSRRVAARAAKKTKNVAHVIGNVGVGPHDIAAHGGASGLPATNTHIQLPRALLHLIMYA